MSIFRKIPNEILNQIFNFTNIFDMFSYQFVCRRFNKIIKNNEKYINEKEKILNIRNINKLFEKCKYPCKYEDIDMLLEYLRKYGVDNPGIPKELEIMWRISSEWHLIENHYDVFGFNIHSPEQIIKIESSNCIFGDENIRKEWNKEGYDIFGHECLCGDRDWVCIVAYSEYDYIFVNLNKNSSYFGFTRHMVNNSGEDNHLTDAPFEKFINYIKDYILDYYLEHIEEEYEDIEINENIEYFLQNYGSKKYGSKFINNKLKDYQNYVSSITKS